MITNVGCWFLLIKAIVIVMDKSSKCVKWWGEKREEYACGLLKLKKRILNLETIVDILRLLIPHTIGDVEQITK